MASGFSFKDIDRGYKKIIERTFRNKKRYYVDVGILEEVNAPKKKLNGEHSSTTLVQVAAYNEFGTEHIPQRSFLRESFDRTQGWMKLRFSLLQRVVKGVFQIDSALKILGSGVVKSIKKTIRDVVLPLNAPSTQRQKAQDSGDNIPLIATGQLINSIVYRLFKK